MLRYLWNENIFHVIDDKQEIINSVGLSDDDVIDEMKLLLSSSESPVRKIAGHILLEIAQDKETHEQIISSGCVSHIIQNTLDVHCGSVMALLIYKLSNNSHLTRFLFGQQLFRTLLQNTRDSDSKEWNYHIFLALVNTCSDLSPLHSIDGSFSSLHHYVKLILSVFKRDYSDERDWSLNRILEDDNLFNQGRYSSFMLESLPKTTSKDIQHQILAAEPDTKLLPSSHSSVYLLFSLINVFEQSASLIRDFLQSPVQLNSLLSNLQLLLTSAENYQSTPRLGQEPFPPRLHIFCGVVLVYYSFLRYIASPIHDSLFGGSMTTIVHSALSVIERVVILECTTQCLSNNSLRFLRVCNISPELEPTYDLFLITFERMSHIFEIIRTSSPLQSRVSSIHHLDDLIQSVTTLIKKYHSTFDMWRKNNQKSEQLKRKVRRSRMKQIEDEDALQSDDRGEGRQGNCEEFLQADKK